MLSFKKFLESQYTFSNHSELNSKLWDGSVLKSDVQVALKRIADEFIEFLGINPSGVSDVILTGSNANYNWTETSDIDLHIIIDMGADDFCPDCPSSDFIQDCFYAKKSLWNSTHNITIYGHDVELYAQDSSQSAVQGSGIYSLNSNTWVQEPTNQQVDVDDISIELKAKDLMNQIDSLIDSQSDDLDELEQCKEKIRKLRSSGLQTGGEFSVENLAFKVLRKTGYIDKLSNYIKDLEDKSLSVY